MQTRSKPIQCLLSLPQNMAAYLRDTPGALPSGWFAAADPPEGNAGSGGGTAHLLVEAWRASDSGLGFADWQRAGRHQHALER